MIKNNVFFSICIPTFNRAHILEETLKSITTQEIFYSTNDIEVAISDNNSSDYTEVISKKFVKLFPNKISYHKHERNIGADLNFNHVLSMGSGNFLKLHNDNLLFYDGSLLKIVEILRKNADKKPVIFFTNGFKLDKKNQEACSTFAEFINRVSYFSTWIGGFSIWKDKYDEIDDFTKNSGLKLTQTDVLFDLLSKNTESIILYEKYFDAISVGPKSGYNIAEVFGRNYLALLRNKVKIGDLTIEAYEDEKKLVLVHMIIPFYFSEYHNFTKNGFFIFLTEYLHNEYFYDLIGEIDFK